MAAAPTAAVRNPEDVRRELAQAYREVLTSRAGGLVWADLDTHFGGNPFDPASERITSCRCGHLQVLQYILEQAARAQDQSPRQEQAL
jgi:hypothetical protein